MDNVFLMLCAGFLFAMLAGGLAAKLMQKPPNKPQTATRRGIAGLLLLAAGVALVAVVVELARLFRGFLHI